MYAEKTSVSIVELDDVSLESIAGGTGHDVDWDKFHLYFDFQSNVVQFNGNAVQGNITITQTNS
jgi:hypothetical protein